MRRILVPARGPGRLPLATGAIVLLTTVALGLAGCNSNTPTAAGATVTVTTAVPTTVTAAPASTAPTSSRSSPTTAGTVPPLPAELAGLQTLDAAATANGGDRAKTTVKTNSHSKQLTAKAYGDAYGTPAEVETYASADLLFLATVIAVGAQSPGLTIGPVSDPTDLGLAVSMTTVSQDGQVQCVVNAGGAVPSGQQVDPAKAITTQCQRTGPGLTVMVFANVTGTAGHRDMVDLTNASWTAAGGN